MSERGFFSLFFSMENFKPSSENFTDGLIYETWADLQSCHEWSYYRRNSASDNEKSMFPKDLRINF